MGKNLHNNRNKKNQNDTIDMNDNEMNVDRTNAILDIIKDARRRINVLEETSFKFVESNDSRKQDEFKKEMAKIVSEIKDKIQVSNRKLEQIKLELNNKIKIQKDFEMNDSVTRFQYQFANCLQTSIFKLVKDFSGVQGKIKQLYQKKILKQLELDNPNVDKKLLNRLMEDPESMSQLSGQLSGDKAKITAAIQAMRQRVDDISRLESKVGNILEMIKELHTIMLNQTASIDSISSNMEKIKDYVAPTVQNIKDSNELSISIQEVF